MTIYDYQFLSEKSEEPCLTTTTDQLKGNKEQLKLEEFYVGYLITYEISSNCRKKDVLTLHCQTSTDCIIK